METKFYKKNAKKFRAQHRQVEREREREITVTQKDDLSNQNIYKKQFDDRKWNKTMGKRWM